MILLPLIAQLTAPAAPCADPQTQTEMTICAARDFEQADRQLNAQWSITAEAMRERDAASGGAQDDHRPGYFETLLEAQRAWLKFRDAHCTSVGFYARGGSMEPMLVGLCRAELTEARIGQLRELAERP